MNAIKNIWPWVCKQNKNIWVAYSGGVDSHVLLHLARQEFTNLQAIHINDGLSPNSKQWQHHCEQQCAALNIPLTTVTAVVIAKPKQSLEDAAREARRTAWQASLQPDDVLMLAHHAADQAETILYRLFRGTGPTGLVGMQVQSKLGGITLLRPLLECPKADIIGYAKSHNLKYIDDETNADNKFDRNFIRNNIMPLLTERWPAVVANINRAGILSAQVLDCLQPEIDQKLAQLIDLRANSWNIARWSNLSSIWRTATLRAWLQQQQISASLQQLQTIENEVIAAALDAQPQFLIGGKLIRRFQGKLYVLDDVVASSNAIAADFSINWDLKTELQLPDGSSIQPEQLITNHTQLQQLQQKTIVVKKGARGVKAKKLFQRFGVPIWERHKYPLVFADGKLVAIIGLWCYY